MHSALPKALVLLLLLSLCTKNLSAQSDEYYVVIGAFAKESNAKKFSGFARSRFFQATYELHPTRNLFYVYVIKSADRQTAIEQVKRLQQEETFKDSWVFKGKLGIDREAPVIKSPVITPVVTPPADSVKLQPEISLPKEEPVTEDSTFTSSTDSVQTVIDTVTSTQLVISSEELPLKAKGKFFKFTILSADGQPISGNVHHVDLKRGRDLASYKSNTYSDVPRPANREEPMTIVCGIFGYKEVTQLVDYLNPALTTGASVDNKGIWTIPFNLERLKKGDISVMYDVSFYKDAVIMLPRSQEELDELVAMMKANPNYRIKIHGHCNGKNKRKIIALGKQRNYFDIKGSNDQNGSAKKLSELRAEAIQDYLKEHGIAKERSEIMAWGGTNMLVSETSSSARLNDRIEIEIMAD